MKLEIKNLDKHIPKVLRPVGPCIMMAELIEFMRKSPEEQEKEIHEALMKKYEEGP